jgi:hypothetical protein
MGGKLFEGERISERSFGYEVKLLQGREYVELIPNRFIFSQANFKKGGADYLSDYFMSQI